MVRKYFKRKYYRKRGKTSGSLKKSAIFSRRSAKSQAKQIYRLNKKVNYVSRINRPDIEVLSNNIIKETSYGGTTSALKNRNGVFSVFRQSIFDTVNPGINGHLNIVGDKMRFKKLQLYGYFGFFDDFKVQWPAASIGGTVENRRDGIYDPSASCYLRIIVCKLIKSTANLPLKITTDVGNIYSTSTPNDLTPIFGPLVNKITGTMKVLKNKVIKIDSTKNSGKAFKITIPGYTIRKGITTGANVDDAGSILVYWQYSASNLFQYVDPNNTAHILGPNTFFNLNYKLVYYNTKEVEFVSSY